MEAKIILGKISYYDIGEREGLFPVEVEVRLEEERGKYRFAASGSVWQPDMRDIVLGGQIIDELLKWFPNNRDAYIIYYFWKRFHLNDMNAGCKHQQVFGWSTGYDGNPDMVGKPCPVCGYKFGSRWLYNPIPEEDLNEIKQFIESHNKEGRDVPS